MNKAILIVICDFLVSAMLTMMTGMVPAHTGGTGVGLDEKTTKLLLSELDTHRAELEKLRSKLRQTIESAGSTPELEAELQRLVMEIAANKIKREKLLAQLRATPENTGKLSEKDLQKQLDEERERRARLEIMLNDRDRDLSHTKERLADTRERLKDSRRSVAAQERELSRTRQALENSSRTIAEMGRDHAAAVDKMNRDHAAAVDKMNRDHAATVDKMNRDHAATVDKMNRDHAATVTRMDQDHRQTRDKLEQTSEKLSQSDRQLNEAKQAIEFGKSLLRSKERELQTAQHTIGSVRGKNESLNKQLAFTSGQLRVRESEQASLKDDLTRTRRNLEVAQLECAEARVKSEEMSKTVKDAVAQLSAARDELRKLDVAKGKVEAKLASTENWLKENASRRNDVIESYSSSIVKFQCSVSEEKIFGEHNGSSTYYFPVVDFGGKPLLIGTLNKFAGDADSALSFNNVTKVLFTALAPGSQMKPLRLGGPILYHKNENRAAAIEYNGKDRTPLDLLTATALKKRGLDNLYLFKATSLGKDSTLLDGRCSLSIAPGDNTMFVRNAGRASVELRAEPGDFILTREGEFVGIAVAADTSAKIKGVRVLLFENENNWQDAGQIPVTKRTADKYYIDFGKKMREIRRKIEADSRRR